MWWFETLPLFTSSSIATARRMFPFLFSLFTVLFWQISIIAFSKDLFLWQSKFSFHILVTNTAFLKEKKFHFYYSGETNQIYKNVCTTERLLKYSKSNSAMSNNYFPLLDNWNIIHVIYNQNLPERWWQIYLLIYQIHLNLSLKVRIFLPSLKYHC